MLFRVGGCRWNTVAINLYVYRSDNEIDARGPALAGEAASLNEEPLGHYAAMGIQASYLPAVLCRHVPKYERESDSLPFWLRRIYLFAPVQGLR